MILVTGTKRSGTSMWMQVLRAAGLPSLGEAFPRHWGDGPMRDGNPGGYHESRFREGIAWHTNPDPRTGAYLHPADGEGRVVKVFLPGLARTDLAFIEAVVFTVRDWRTQASSVARLHALEREQLGERLPPGAEQASLAHVLEWWMENAIGLRDVIARGYPTFLVGYDALVDTPEAVLDGFFDWLDRDGVDRAAAVAAVRPGLRRSAPAPTPSGLDDDAVAVFDELVARVRDGIGLDEDFVGRMDAVHRRLAPLISEHVRQAAQHRALQSAEPSGAS